MVEDIYALIMGMQISRRDLKQGKKDAEKIEDKHFAFDIEVGIRCANVTAFGNVSYIGCLNSLDQKMLTQTAL